MSSKRKGSKEKEKKDKTWQVIRNKIQIFHEFKNETCLGFYFWPQFGTGLIQLPYTVYEYCGADVIDPVDIQGTRIVKDLKIRVSQFANQISKNIIVVIYKYNKAYGGRPCCDYLPEASENLYRGLYSYNIINNYQNVLGQTVFNSGDETEHIICVEDEIILEAGDVIKASIGNIPPFGTITQSTGNPPTYTWNAQIVNGLLGITAVAEGAIAFL